MGPEAKIASDELVQNLLEKGLIKESKSPWASPVVMVKKRDGSFRMCIDFRGLNGVSKQDAYPLHRIDETLESLGNAKWFCTADLSSGYWQIKMSPESKEKTAFCTRKGLFEWNVMPFGLSSAVATFQRLMETMLGDMRYTSCLVYIDDLFLYGSDFDSTLDRLKELCERLRNAKLKLKPKKCTFFQKSVLFLGHKVGENGIETDPEKVEAVSNWKVPENKKEVKSFLGTVGYYRRFIHNYSTVAKPMTSLTSNSTEFIWTLKCQAAFESLKNSLLTAPILGYPKDEGEFILDTDASNVGIGGVLSQVQNGQEVVISYGSRTLNEHELNYCVTRKELLAVVAHIRLFRSYLLGRHFTVRTDHGSLRYWRKFKDPVDQLGRWLDFLQSFDFEVISRPGTQHGNADGLSRKETLCIADGKKKCFCKQFEDLELDPPVVIETQKYAEIGIQVDSFEFEAVKMTTEKCEARVVEVLQFWTIAEMRAAQEEDTDIGPILKLREASETKPVWENVSHLSADSKLLISEWSRLCIKDDLLHRIWENNKGDVKYMQLAIPSACREKVLYSTHDHVTTGHNGGLRTYLRVREKFFWPKMRDHIRRWVMTCKTCQERKGPVAKAKAPMSTYIVGAPGERVSTDISGPYSETERGNKWIICFGDLFTKYCVAVPLPDITAPTVAEAFIESWVCYFGVPKEIHSDKGAQYESAVFTEMCKLLGLEKTRTTTMNPQSNGFIEHMNRTFCNMLNCVVKENPFEWDMMIKLCMLAYNSSVQESTHETPSMLAMGNQPILPVDFLTPTFDPSGTRQRFNSAQEYVLYLQARLQKVQAKARESMQGAALKQTKQYNNRLKVNAYERGAQVYYFYPVKNVHTSKESYFMWKGPYTVITKISDLIYRIQEKPGSEPIIVHHNKLKPAHCRNPVDITWLETNETTNSQNLSSDTNQEDELSSRPRRTCQMPSRFGEWYLD